MTFLLGYCIFGLGFIAGVYAHFAMGHGDYENGYDEPKSLQRYVRGEGGNDEWQADRNTK